ncbi:MAG: hypothetical protein JSS02_34705, partial [Planctomycetes bacterium]|nr:hypothetical protein [Planctomycetota bacterium]
MSAATRLMVIASLLAVAGLQLRSVAAEPPAVPAANCPDDCADDGLACQDEAYGAYCKLAPEVKTVKRWVYSCKLVPYCRPNCPNPLQRWGENEKCTVCECCPRYKRVLIKREVIEKKETLKCVVEEVKSPAALPRPTPVSREKTARI